MGLLKDIREILGSKPRIETELAAAEAMARDWAARKSALELQLDEAEAMSAKDRAKALEARDLDMAAKAALVPDAIRVKIGLATDMLASAQADVQRIRDRLAEVATAQRWADLEKLLKARRAALATVEKHAQALGQAMVDAQAAAQAAFDVLPIKTLTSPGAVDNNLSAPYVRLDSEVALLMSLATDGKVGSLSGSMLWEQRQKPGLIQRADENAAEWLALRPYRDEPDQAA